MKTRIESRFYRFSINDLAHNYCKYFQKSYFSSTLICPILHLCGEMEG